MVDYNKFQVLRKVRDAVVLSFREAFKTDDDYTFNEDPEETDLSIVDATPLMTAELPAIVVSALSGREERYLGPDMLGENDQQQDEFFVSIPMTISIKTYVLDVMARDELTDRMFEYLKIACDVLSQMGVAIHRTNIGNDTREFLQDRWWYNSNVSIDVYTEWKYTDTESFDVISAIRLIIDEVIQTP